MHSVEAWLSFNDLSQSIVGEVARGRTELLLSGSQINYCAANKQLPVSKSGCLDLTLSKFIDQVLTKALSGIFSSEKLCTKAIASIEFEVSQHSGINKNSSPPYALDRGNDKKPLVSVYWNRSAEDCIALAHETSHAMQFILSNHEQMPPVARETCAFLGELILIEWAKQNKTNLFGQLLTVWQSENSAYLGSDIDRLEEALRDPSQPYNYRLNYPLARLAAIHIFETRSIEDIRNLFSSGKNAMALIPFDAIADLANTAENYLPAMPRHDSAYPALDAYRGLGAIALLDIDYWQGPSETRIEDYYANLLVHLQNQTAFVALRADRKPIGYATWQQKSGGNSSVLTRQSAPFGDHLQLQKAVESHLGVNEIGSHHNRSSRQEQRAW